MAARVGVLPNDGSAGINANRSRADRILRINRDGRRSIRELQKAVIAAGVVNPDEGSRGVNVPSKGADAPWYIVRLELIILHDVSMRVPRCHVSPASNNGVAAGSRTIIHGILHGFCRIAQLAAVGTKADIADAGTRKPNHVRH